MVPRAGQSIRGRSVCNSKLKSCSETRSSQGSICGLVLTLNQTVYGPTLSVQERGWERVNWGYRSIQSYTVGSTVDIMVHVSCSLSTRYCRLRGHGSGSDRGPDRRTDPPFSPGCRHTVPPTLTFRGSRPTVPQTLW